MHLTTLLSGLSLFAAAHCLSKPSPCGQLSITAKDRGYVDVLGQPQKLILVSKGGKQKEEWNPAKWPLVQLRDQVEAECKKMYASCQFIEVMIDSTGCEVEVRTAYDLHFRGQDVKSADFRLRYSNYLVRTSAVLPPRCCSAQLTLLDVEIVNARKFHMERIKAGFGG